MENNYITIQVDASLSETSGVRQNKKKKVRKKKKGNKIHDGEFYAVNQFSLLLDLSPPDTILTP